MQSVKFQKNRATTTAESELELLLVWIRFIAFPFAIFEYLSARPSFSLTRVEGKSGQQRATHRLIAGARFKAGTDSATENNHLAFIGRIRVKT